MGLVALLLQVKLHTKDEARDKQYSHTQYLYSKLLLLGVFTHLKSSNYLTCTWVQKNNHIQH